jgi:tetratricopeptide (TPR) repeat protein
MKASVVLVHGTGSTSAFDAGDQWWQRGSRFHAALQEELGSEFEVQPSDMVFHWSGANRESERRRASERLTNLIMRHEAEGIPYHLIGHSHGGSVVWGALVSAACAYPTLPHLRSWTTVGTPFLIHRTLVQYAFLSVPFMIAVEAIWTLTGSGWDFFREFTHVLERGGGSVLGFVSLWVLLAACVLLIMLLLGSFVLEVYRQFRHKHASIAGWRELSNRYLGIWSKGDEAINGLSRSLDLARELPSALRRGDRQAPLPTDQRLRMLLTESLHFLYRTVASLTVEPFVWRYVMRKLQGTDLFSLELQTVRPQPIAGVLGWPSIFSEIDNELIEHANRHAAETAAAAREMLGVAAQSSSEGSGFIVGLTKKFTWTELVHTSYFDSAGVRKLVAGHIHMGSATPFSNGWYTDAKARVNTRVAAKHVAGQSKPKNFEPFVLTALLTCVLFGLVAATTSLQESVITENTDRFQLQMSISDAAALIGSADSTGGELPSDAWILELARANLVSTAVAHSFLRAAPFARNGLLAAIRATAEEGKLDIAKRIALKLRDPEGLIYVAKRLVSTSRADADDLLYRAGNEAPSCVAKARVYRARLDLKLPMPSFEETAQTCPGEDWTSLVKYFSYDESSLARTCVDLRIAYQLLGRDPDAVKETAECIGLVRTVKSVAVRSINLSTIAEQFIQEGNLEMAARLVGYLEVSDKDRIASAIAIGEARRNRAAAAVDDLRLISPDERVRAAAAVSVVLRSQGLDAYARQASCVALKTFLLETKMSDLESRRAVIKALNMSAPDLPSQRCAAGDLRDVENRTSGDEALQRIRELGELGKADEGEKIVKQLLSYPDEGYLELAVGLISARKRGPAEAIIEAHGLSGNFPSKLATAYEKVGDKETAQKLWRRAFDESCNDRSYQGCAFSNIAEVARHLPAGYKPREVLAKLETFEEFSPRNDQSPTCLALAVAWAERGLLKKARIATEHCPPVDKLTAFTAILQFCATSNCIARDADTP